MVALSSGNNNNIWAMKGRCSSGRGSSMRNLGRGMPNGKWKGCDYINNNNNRKGRKRESGKGVEIEDLINGNIMKAC